MPKSLYLSASAFMLLILGTASAQEVLPRPAEPFKGKIGLTCRDSEAVKPKLKVPATFGVEDPPNILLVLIDDAGYGQFSTFGGDSATAILDRFLHHAEIIPISGKSYRLRNQTTPAVDSTEDLKPANLQTGSAARKKSKSVPDNSAPETEPACES